MSLRLCLIAVFTAASLSSCGGSGDEPVHGPVTFVFRLHGFPSSEEFRGVIASPDFIAKARAQLRLPEDQRRLFASGAISPGNGGNSSSWSWHFSTLGLSETSIELCDGIPSMVQADLDYWLNTVKNFCPWSSYVYAELL
jgi:hypothetical protein